MVEVVKKMDPEKKAGWVERLRSGRYRQGQGQLRTHLDDDYYYCCLGVLCEMYREETGEGGWLAGDYSRFDAGDGATTWSSLPGRVARWAGFVPEGVQAHVDYTDPMVVAEYQGREEPVALATLNDGGETFERIADLIEQQL